MVIGFVKIGRKVEEELCSGLKVNHQHIEVNYSDCGSPIKCLWIKIRRDISKGDLRLGIFY